MMKMTTWENLGLRLIFANANAAIASYNEKVVLSKEDRLAVELIKKHLGLTKWGLDLLIELREKKPRTLENLSEKAEAEREYGFIEPLLPQDEEEKKNMFDDLIVVCEHILDGTVSSEERTRLHAFGRKYIEHLSIAHYESQSDLADIWP